MTEKPKKPETAAKDRADRAEHTVIAPDSSCTRKRRSHAPDSPVQTPVLTSGNLSAHLAVHGRIDMMAKWRENMRSAKKRRVGDKEEGRAYIL